MKKSFLLPQLHPSCRCSTTKIMFKMFFKCILGVLNIKCSFFLVAKSHHYCCSYSMTITISTTTHAFSACLLPPDTTTTVILLKTGKLRQRGKVRQKRLHKTGTQPLFKSRENQKTWYRDWPFTLVLHKLATLSINISGELDFFLASKCIQLLWWVVWGIATLLVPPV